MKVIKDYNESAPNYGVEHIDTERLSLDGGNILVENADGFGGCDITIGSHTMSWEDLDKLKEAISIAEKLWRAK